MKKVIIVVIIILFAVGFYGCSLQQMYVLRNFSNVPITITAKIGGLQKNDSIEIANSSQIVPLKKSELKTSFVKKTIVKADDNGVIKFSIPANQSASISNLIRKLHVAKYRDNASGEFSIESENGNPKLLFGNDLEQIHRIFKLKSFSFGPLVYYLDL